MNYTPYKESVEKKNYKFSLPDITSDGHPWICVTLNVGRKIKGYKILVDLTSIETIKESCSISWDDAYDEIVGQYGLFEDDEERQAEYITKLQTYYDNLGKRMIGVWKREHRNKK